MGQSKPLRAVTATRCPVCKEPGSEAYRPFCSKRCADVDLARWLGGGYVIEGGKEDADEDGDDAQAARIAGTSPTGEPNEDE